MHKCIQLDLSYVNKEKVPDVEVVKISKWEIIRFENVDEKYS